jgi:hypothetical protein
MECYIEINGVKMTEKEYKEFRKQKLAAKTKKVKKPKRKPKDVNTKEISGVALQIEKMLKPLTTLKSFSAYYDHAYRQWGTIARDILNLREIRPHFVFYRVKVRELEVLLDDIQKMAKRNERAAYQYVEKMVWKLDDIKTDINNIAKGVNTSGVIQQFKNHECINGKGRRLGLETLMNRTIKAISEIEDVIGTLQKIADDGVDVMNEGAHMSPRARARCWA